MVRHACGQGVGVGLGDSQHGLHAQRAAGAHDSHSDLAAVGDQNAPDIAAWDGGLGHATRSGHVPYAARQSPAASPASAEMERRGAAWAVPSGARPTAAVRALVKHRTSNIVTSIHGV
ncbi:hypothetical protein D3C79_920200 [compost metagenome]